MKIHGWLVALLAGPLSFAVFAEERGVPSPEEARIYQNCCSNAKVQELPSMFGRLKSGRMFDWKKRKLLLHASNDAGMRQELYIRPKSRFIAAEFKLSGKDFF